MAIHVEHPLHARRRGRNLGVLLLLLGMVVMVFALTVVKVLELGDPAKFEAFDYVVRPQLLPADAGDAGAAPAPNPAPATP